MKYETHISGELVRWVDAKYRTIAGLSMGGHGDFKLSYWKVAHCHQLFFNEFFKGNLGNDTMANEPPPLHR